MKAGEPSRTALGAAEHRAAHQILERGIIFSDPLAVRILGDATDAVLERARRDPSIRRLRIFVAARSRYAEDALQLAVACGVRQLVILGAGLDTYAYRSEPRSGLRIFEVDHPATQEWKRRRLAEVDIGLPSSLVFAPVDFERESLADGLAAAGFDPAQPTFFTWLGVVYYLTDPSIFATLGFIASLPGGAHVVFDYSNPSQALPEVERGAHDQLAAQVADLGESFRTHFETEVLHARLREVGFREIEDLGPMGIVARFLPGRTRAGPDRGGHIVRASTVPLSPAGG
jgi:methyltransferase (TIGR00027 family)